VSSYRSSTSEGGKLRNFLKLLVKASGAEFVESGDYDYWRVFPGRLKALSNYFVELEGSPKTSDEARGEHPRYFSGDVREMALADFEKAACGARA